VWIGFYHKVDAEQKYVLMRSFKPDWLTDVDYDGFDWGNAPNAFRWDDGKLTYYKGLAEFAEAVGIEKHGRRVRKEEIFEKWDIPDTLARVEPQVLTLKAGCNAIDAGDALPNVAEDFVGKAPDLGAHEFGAPLPHYGPREKTAR